MGGRPCVGETILERPCNTKACPTIVSEKSEKIEGEAKFKMF